MATSNGKRTRSGLESKITEFLDENEIQYAYEEETLSYDIPAREATYLPDLCFKYKGKLYVEVKGRFTATDRKKMLLVKKSNPLARIIMVFPKPYNTIRKGSKTTYANWCDKNEIDWMSVEDFFDFAKAKLR